MDVPERPKSGDPTGIVVNAAGLSCISGDVPGERIGRLPPGESDKLSYDDTEISVHVNEVPKDSTDKSMDETSKSIILPLEVMSDHEIVKKNSEKTE